MLHISERLWSEVTSENTRLWCEMWQTGRIVHEKLFHWIRAWDDSRANHELRSCFRGHRSQSTKRTYLMMMYHQSMTTRRLRVSVIVHNQCKLKRFCPVIRRCAALSMWLRLVLIDKKGIALTLNLRLRLMKWSLKSFYVMRMKHPLKWSSDIPVSCHTKM